MKRKNILLFTLFIGVALPVAGFAQETHKSMEHHKAAFNKAVAVVHPTEGSDTSGTVTFTKTEAGIRIEAKLSGLGEGMHGFHIHQYGDCTASDGTSAGGHFNPEDTAHAGPEESTRHVGDLGNIEAGADGNATYNRLDDVISFYGDHNIVGRAVVVHAKKDDLTSQPTGDAGGRLGCGVIGIANPEQ
jgi:Cu-Zn family superoxide dismutase